MKLERIAGLGLPMLFLHPISGFLLSLLNVRSKRTFVVYLLFAMIFGYSISFTNTSADSYRYAVAFKNFDNTLDYSEIVEMYQQGELRDLYRLLLFYFVSLFSSNPKVMYAFAGLVYGLFSYFSLRLFVKEMDAAISLKTLILLLVFYTFVSLSNINGFRFHTGSVILFFSAFQFIINNKLRWVVGILITPYFHYGFLLIVPFFVAYKFFESFLIKNNKIPKTLFYLFLITFAASFFLKTNSINLSFLSQSEVISGEVASRVEFINSSDVASKVEKRREDSLFLGVQQYFDFLIKAFILFAVFKIKKTIENQELNDKRTLKIFALALFLYCVCFIAVSFPSGGRFLVFAHLFLFILIGRIYGRYKINELDKLIYLSFPAFSFHIAFLNFVIPLMITSGIFWYGNLFWIILDGIN